MSYPWGSPESAYGAGSDAPLTFVGGRPGITPAARAPGYAVALPVGSAATAAGARDCGFSAASLFQAARPVAVSAARSLTWSWTWPLGVAGISSGARTATPRVGQLFVVSRAYPSAAAARAAAFLPHTPFVAPRIGASPGARSAAFLPHTPFLASPAGITPGVRAVVFRAVLFEAAAAGVEPAARPMAAWPWVLLLDPPERGDLVVVRSVPTIERMYLVAGERRDIGFDFRKHLDADDVLGDVQWSLSGEASLHGRGAVGAVAWVRVSDVPPGSYTDLTAQVRITDGRVMRRTLRVLGVDTGLPPREVA